MFQENDFAEAYRLYIVERWRFEELKISSDIWDSKEAVFDITERQHINRLAENAFAHGFLDKEWKDPGNNLSKIFSGDQKNFKSDTLTKIAVLIGLKKFADFQESTELFDAYLKKVQRNGSGYTGPTGLFILLSTSSFRKGIVKYPALFHKDGKVEIITAWEDGRKQRIVTGAAKMIAEKKCLILNFHSEYKEGGPFMGVYYYYIQNTGIGFGTGASLRINDSGNPQAKREYMIPLKSEKKNLEVEFRSSKFSRIYSNSELYKQLKRTYPKCDSLFGREYNLIIETRHTNSPGKLFKREAFDKMYFHEALLEYIMKKNEKIRDYFELAMEHGLFLENRFDQCMEEFCNAVKLNTKEQDQLKNFFRASFEKLFGIYASGDEYQHGL